MCAFARFHSSSFKWITYLVVVAGVYTFLHWFLAVPLLYSHFHDCCDDAWPKDWVVWFLAVAFGAWLAVCLAVFLCWCCLGACAASRLTDSNARLVSKAIYHSDKTDSEVPKALREVDLPEFTPRGSFTVLQVNDVLPREESISGSEFPIPVEESQHYVQAEAPEPPPVEDNPPKTPREIFFKDLIEAASNSEARFDFDLERPSEPPAEVEEDRSKNAGDKYFIASAFKTDNFTSEILCNLDERGVVVDEPEVLGQFQVLKD